MHRPWDGTKLVRFQDQKDLGSVRCDRDEGREVDRDCIMQGRKFNSECRGKPPGDIKEGLNIPSKLEFPFCPWMTSHRNLFPEDRLTI